MSLGLALAAALLVACAPAGSAKVLDRWELTACDGRQVSVQLPAHLDDVLPEHPCTYTLEATVAPTRDLRAGAYLTVQRLSARVKLEVDGRPVAALEHSALEGYRTQGFHSFRLDPEVLASDVVRLRLTVDHTWFQSAWLDHAPVLTAQPHALGVLRFNRYMPAFSVGVLTAIALVFALLVVLNRERRAYGWFALGAVVVASYPMWEWGVLMDLVGPYDTAVLGICLPMAPVALVYCMHRYFGLPEPSRAWQLMPVIALGLVLWSPEPFGLITRLWVNYAVAVIGIGVGYNTLLLLRLTLRAEPPRNAAAFLACWLFLSATTWSDLVVWVGLGDVAGGVRATNLGLAVFGLLQGLILGSDFLWLNTELRTQVHELEKKRAENELLNQELRRQIADRSELLVAALSQLDAREQNEMVSLARGDVVQGRYRVLDTLGSGGMGTVFEVERLQDGQHFAMKVAQQRHPDALATLAREAKIAARAQHENVVCIVDFDVAAAGFLYLVLEMVHGTGLHRHQARFGDVPWALDVLWQIALGMRALHEVGVIHRDLKPANVLVADRPDAPGRRIKLADFGISKFAEQPRAGGSLRPPPPPPQGAVASEDPDPTAVLPPGALDASTPDGPAPLLVGTPLYMAPESVHHDIPVTSAVDVYAFGVMAWQLLTGMPPFASSAALRALQGLPMEAVPQLRERVPELYAPLSEALDACLSADPLERPTAARLVALFAESKQAAA